VGGFLFKTLLIALVFCLAVTLFNISLQGATYGAGNAALLVFFPMSCLKNVGRSRGKNTTNTIYGESESYISLLPYF
jgi:hypothetical protein